MASSRVAETEDFEVVEVQEEEEEKKKMMEHGFGLVRLSKKIEQWIAMGCARIAVAVSSRPGRTMWSSLLICALLSLGWFRIDNEQQVENLYTPQHTRAFRDRRWVEDHFTDADSPATVLLNRENGRTNLLDPGAIEEAFDIYEKVLSIDSEKHSRGFDERSCAKVYWTSDAFPNRQGPDETCQKSGILAFWDWNRTKFYEDSDIVGTINSIKEDCCDPSAREVNLIDVAAKFEYDDPTDRSKVTGVGSLKMSFFLTTSLNKRSREDPHNMRLFNKFDRRLRRMRSRFFQQAMPLTEWGLRTNSDTSFDADQIFINIAIVVIVVYAYLALWNYRNPEKSRGLLGLGAVATVIISTIAGFGVAMVSGVTFSPSTSVAVFLVLGIGLDDSFVIAGAIDEPFDFDWYDPTRSALENDALRVLDAKESVEEVAGRRIIHTLRSSGPSITVTSVTDTAAFLAGSVTRTPDIAAFNRFCAISVMVDFALQLTFFVALLTFDQRRRLRKKVAEMQRDRDNVKPKPSCLMATFRSCLECRVAPATATTDAVVVENQDQENGNSELPAASVADQKPVPLEIEKVSTRKKYFDGDHTFWTTHYPRYLLSVPGKIFVLSASVAVLALAIVGCARFTVDIDESWPFVDVGPYKYARRAWDYSEDHYSNSATQWVGLYTKHADYFAAEQDMRNVIDGYASQGFVVTSSLEDNWYDEHKKWILETNRTVTSNDEWKASLQAFLAADAGEGFVDKIAFDGAGNIVGAEIDTRWEDEDVTGGMNMRRMRNSREEVRKRSGSLGTVIIYNTNFVWAESFAFIASSVFLSMIIAVSTVFVVLVLLLGDIFAATLVTGFVADVCICVFGSIYWYDDAVNYITAFFIVVAVGLSADAPAHVCKAFLESRQPSRHDRAQEALAKLGPSVFRGGVSTILGIAITGFCVPYIFLTFFRYLMTILVLSLWNGLAVMPVVCSLIGPMPDHDIIVHA